MNGKLNERYNITSAESVFFFINCSKYNIICYILYMQFSTSSRGNGRIKEIYNIL